MSKSDGWERRKREEREDHDRAACPPLLHPPPSFPAPERGAGEKEEEGGVSQSDRKRKEGVECGSARARGLPFSLFSSSLP